MDEPQVVVESQPTMDISRGPLVDITPEQRTEFRKTGNLPEPPKKEEAAPSSEAKPDSEAKPAGDSEPPKVQEHTERKPKAQTAEERIAQLESTIEKIKKGAGLEKPKADSEPAKSEPKPAEPQYTRPKPTVDDKDDKGTPKYATYEDYIEDLTDWKGEQRDAKNQRIAQEQAQAKAFNSKVEEARSRYENFDEVVGPTAAALNGNANINPVVKQMLLDSEHLPDLLFTIGSNDAEKAKFTEMAEKNPGKALRYIALTESLIAEELEAKAKPAEEAPVKPKTQAPKPPSEAGGRAAAPPDALEAAAKANDFRSFKAEATRRQLAKLKG